MTFTDTVLSAVPPRPSETMRRRTAGPAGPGPAENWDETFPLPLAAVKVPVAVEEGSRLSVQVTGSPSGSKMTVVRVAGGPPTKRIPGVAVKSAMTGARFSGVAGGVSVPGSTWMGRGQRKLRPGPSSSRIPAGYVFCAVKPGAV